MKEKWIYFVKHAEELTAIPEDLKAPPELVDALEAANRFGWTREELEAYEMRGVYIQDERGRVAFAHAEGRAEGRTEGRAEGLVEGVEKVARNMKSRGMPASTIQELTGLTLEQIERL